MSRKLMEGSRAVAEAVASCRPLVISAYPITPQTHIVQELAQMVADGKLKAEYVNVESEHSAASVVLGASATGVRVYTATTSQGLLLMTEVLYNIAGMRLPVVMTCVNRAVSAPLNIWTDQQDSISVRDSGWIQLYAEDGQEAVDLTFQAYRIAEDHRIMLPVMICMDGYVLSHAYESLDVPGQEEVDSFLPPFQPVYRLDPDEPLTFGAYAEPDKYMETRYMIHRAQQKALEVIPEVAREFERIFGRPSGGLLQTYRMEGASTAVVAMGSMVAAVREAVDGLRARGEKVGVVKLVSYRPFPRESLYRSLRETQHVVVLDKAISLGSGGPLATEVRAIFQGEAEAPRISGFIAGLGGRDVPVESIEAAIVRAQQGVVEAEFLDLRDDLELEGVS
jgi:pyruvate ferredoxin oxidoreductase alpha subunit